VRDTETSSSQVIHEGVAGTSSWPSVRGFIAVLLLPKPETPSGISSSGKSAVIGHIPDAGEHSDEHSEITDPKERLDAILAGFADFLRAQNAVRDS
jgi:hypothetical protein